MLTRERTSLWKIEKRPSAERISMTCFLNSLLREWPAWTYEEMPQILRSFAATGIRIELADQILWLPLRRYSSLGRHSYEYPAYSQSKKEFRLLEFEALAELLIHRLPVGDQSSENCRSRFHSRVSDSRVALGEILNHRSNDFLASPLGPRTFVEAEQSLVIGHAFHPSPKSREGFDSEDRLRYGPEYAGRFPLAWFAVHKSKLRLVAAKSFQGRNWIAELVKSDTELGDLADQVGSEDYRLFPAHPWQAAFLKKHSGFAALMDQGLVRDLGERGSLWFPTSSVRAISRPEAPFMLKTSLNVRLTNSVRSLMIKEVDRGIQVDDVFASTHGQEFLARYPQFHLLREPAYAFILDESGEPIEESIVVCRENPFRDPAVNPGLVLATLNQDDPYRDDTLIGRYVEAYRLSQGLEGREACESWFDHFLHIAVEPLLMAQADYGILLGAHQQNILLAIEDSLPKTLYFRDCQGTGYSERAYELMRSEVDSLDPANGNILPESMALTLFVYYLFINATFNVIVSIARTGHCTEDDLILRLRQKLLALLAEGPADPSCLHHLLQSSKFLHKGNFLCSLNDINENTSADPLAIYTAIENPLTQISSGDPI